MREIDDLKRICDIKFGHFENALVRYQLIPSNLLLLENTGKIEARLNVLCFWLFHELLDLTFLWIKLIHYVLILPCTVFITDILPFHKEQKAISSKSHLPFLV